MKFLVIYKDRQIRVSTDNKKEIITKVCEVLNNDVNSFIPPINEAIISVFDPDFQKYVEVPLDELPDGGELQLTFQKSSFNQ